ncbi:B12-binding domain-containing radical SAM protein [Candidatus Aerophobetes bacterium]|uniref:B12-binding domain-containing radical SAM protein n=1 Tax=Aerophobetes bacterium TaxID=2030807 RepID=A0A662DGT7_UNCAE|nr:MAG: B12-binding domain-containing radical SAM protein [Candidatus Aerophobetes bacterium]
MKVMLILPPSKFVLKDKLGITSVPLGLAYLASFIEKDGHKVKIIDSNTLGYRIKDIKEEIEKFNPHLVGVTATTSCIYDAYEVAKIIKEVDPGIKVVIGGPHVTFIAKETLKECPFIDVVVRGEGEETFRELVNFFESSSEDTWSLEEVKGITFRKDNKIIETDSRSLIKNLDSIPFPAYHLLPMEKYSLEGKRFATIITSRGCPFSCIFCSSSRLFGKTWRARSPENVIEEIKLLKNKYGVREIEFLDDTFTLNKKRAEKICEILIKEKIDISWSCSSRVDTIDESLIEKLKKAGCHTIYVGVESGSQKILNIIDKGITLPQIEKTINLIKKVNINSFGSFILGIPGETVKTIKKTINFAKKLNPSFVQFSICTPYPGTKLFEMAKEKGWLLTKDWSKYTILDQVMKIPGMVTTNLNRWLLRAYLSFYLRPKFILEQLKRKGFFFFVTRKIFAAALEYVGVKR